jgi:surface protein
MGTLIPGLVRLIDMEEMFCEASAFNHDLSKWNTGNVTDVRLMFCEASAFNHARYRPRGFSECCY